VLHVGSVQWSDDAIILQFLLHNCHGGLRERCCQVFDCQVKEVKEVKEKGKGNLVSANKAIKWKSSTDCV